MLSLLVLFASLVSFFAGVQTSAVGQKNVLFFAIDDLRTELGTYNHPEVKSPNIDKLADRSMVFERAYCQVAVCSPSRTALLTGRRPDTNHVWTISADEYWRKFTNATTIPQYFKENGYISIGMGKVFHPGAPNGNDDSMYSWSPEGLPYYHSPIEKDYGPGNKTSSWWSFEGFKDNQLPDGQIADNAVSVLKQLAQNKSNGDDRPFFLAVGFHKPHMPLYAPDQYFDMYPSVSATKLPDNPDAPNGMPDIAWSTWATFRSWDDMKVIFNKTDCIHDAEAIHSQECQMPDNKSREIRRAYYSCVSYTDVQVGKVLKELTIQGFDDNTIIVLWGDHGWQLGEHNEWAKFTNFEDAVHVPFILHVPGMTDNGIRSDALVELIDIFPSLTELAGLTVPSVCPEGSNDQLACIEGTSVAPLLKDPSMEWKKATFSQYPRPSSGLPQIPGHPAFPSGEHGESVMGYTIRVDKFRFTEWYGFNRTEGKPRFDEIWGTELYNHTHPTVFFNDENENLASKPEMQSVVMQLRKQLQAGWRAALP